MSNPNLQPDPPVASLEKTPNLLLSLITAENDACIDSLLSLGAASMGVQQAAISVFDEQTNQIIVRSLSGYIETPAEGSLCGYALKNNETLVVQNSASDDRFSQNPFVTGPAHLRFYVGAPLAIPGHQRKAIFFAFDSAPRDFTDADRALFEKIAAAAQETLYQKILNLESQTKIAQVELDLSSLTHDLKTPFNGLLNMAEELTLLAKSLPDYRLSDVAEVILDSSRAALALVQNSENDLSSSNRTQPANTSLDQLVNDVSALYAPLQQSKRIIIVSKFPLQIEVGPHKEIWKLVLRNLISNSLKHSNPHSEITIEASQSDTHLEVYVRDTGVGMSAETLAAIKNGNPDRLTRFGTKQETGLGKGIQICSLKLAQCDGALSFDSHPNSGTVAKISIPR